MKLFVEGKVVEDPFESIRWFTFCEALKWAHLPAAGGLYDQHPKLLDHWRYIFHERNRVESEKQEKEERERKSQQNKRTRTPGRRR